MTKSTYAPLDDCVVNLEHLKSGKELNTLLEASYQGKNVTFELWHSSTKTKEGHLKLTTPFEALATVHAEYKLSLGNEIQYVAKFDHNDGENRVDFEASGHLRPNDVDVDANVRHSWGDDIIITVNYKNDASEMGAGASLVSCNECSNHIVFYIK